VRRAAFWTLILIFLALFGSRWVQQGLFIDGLWYATIAHNMANGLGSIWAPYFSATCEPLFLSHPPLALWLESLFFRLLGSGFWVENAYCAVVTLLTIALIRYWWRLFYSGKNRVLAQKSPELARYWPIPVAVWMLNEDVYLSYTANMLECTMTLFALGALVALYRWGERPAGIALGAIGTIAACLSKGPAGLFPLAFFAVRYIAGDRTRGIWADAVRPTLWLVSATVALGALLLQFAPIQLFVQEYLAVQVQAALTGHSSHNIAPHRLYVVQRWFETHWIWFVVALVGYFFVFRTLKYRTQSPPALTAPARFGLRFWGLLGASALLPIIISTKQAAHYVVPGLPAFALAVGSVLSAIWHFNVQKNTQNGPLRVQKWLPPALAGAAALLLIWICTQWGQPRSGDRVLLEDMRAIMAVVPDRSTVTFRREGFDSRAYGYFQRYHFVTLDESHYDHRYFIREKAFAMPDSIMVRYRELPLNTRKFGLFELLPKQIISEPHDE
jgi:hypothetical protein